MNTQLGHWLNKQFPENRLHLLRHQPSYLAKGREVKRLVDWLTDVGFLEQKLITEGITSLIDDYDLALPLLSQADQRMLALIQKSLMLSSHILAEDNTQLASQLCGRLLYFPESEIHAFLEQVKQSQDKPWFRPLFPCFDSPESLLIRTFTGHSAFVFAVATIAPDGQSAISGSVNKTLKLWNLKTGQVIRTFEGHSGPVCAVTIAPDGQRAISGSSDNTLKLWSLKTGQEIRTFEGHNDSVQAVAIAPDGQRVISGSWDKTLKLWDLNTGQAIRTFEGHHDLVQAVAISPDGQHAISGSEDNTLKLWDLATGQVIRTFGDHYGSVYTVAISPDGQHAISGSEDTTLKLWNLATTRS